MSAKELSYNIEAVYTPYDDTNSKAVIAMIKARLNTKDGMDTSAFDVWRQGVELTDSKFVYGSSQPKIWAGNTLGITDIVVYGQAPTWTDYEGTIAFDDTVYERTAVETVQNAPVTEVYDQVEEGPMYRDEAIMEALTVPGRLIKDNANPERVFRAGIESGNPNDSYQLGQSSDVIVDVVNYLSPIQERYFVDTGTRYYGLGTDDQKIATENDRSNRVESPQRPFDDTSTNMLVRTLNIAPGPVSDLYKQTILNLKLNLDDDLRNSNGVRSVVCGSDVYGANQAIYGTDSIAFIGTYRG